MSLFSLPPGGLAETRLDQQLRVAVDGREWTGVDAALKQARTFGRHSGVLNLRAVVALSKNDRQTAIDCLRKLLAVDKLDLAMLPRIDSLLQDAGAQTEAAAALERYKQTGGSGELATLTAAELLRRRGEYPDAIRMLEQALAKSSESGRGPMLRQLIAMEIDAGAMQSARQRLLDLRKARSLDMWVYETAADLALMAGDHADLRDCERQLEAVEGPAGTLWRFVRAVQSLESGKDVPDEIRQANKLAGEIKPPGQLAPSKVLQSAFRNDGTPPTQRQRTGAAISARTLTTFQWLVSALYRQNRLPTQRFIGQSGQIAATSRICVAGGPASGRTRRRRAP